MRQLTDCLVIISKHPAFSGVLSSFAPAHCHFGNFQTATFRIYENHISDLTEGCLLV
jgi:hypothetical protein